MRLSIRPRHRRTAVAASVLAVGVGAAFIPFGSSAFADQTITHTFSQVTCSAVTPIGTLSQKQDINVSFIVPDTVAPGEEFTITFPGGSTDLPTTGAGIKINSFSNLSTTYQINNATFVPGSIQSSGSATIDADFAGPNPPVDVASTAEFPTANTYKTGLPGPFPPGTLTTPTVTLKALAPASGNITINALTLTTTTALNSPAVTSAVVTCNIPQDILATIPVVAGTTTTAAPTTTTVAPTTTTTAAPTTTTTVAPTTTTTVAPTTTTTAAPTTTTTAAPTTTTTAAPTTTTTAAPTTTTTAGPTTTTTTAAPTTTTTAGPTTTTAPSTTTTAAPASTTTTVAGACKPGWGYGDKNHCHSGPPGQQKDKNNGKGNNGNTRSIATRLIDAAPAGPAGTVGATGLLVLAALAGFTALTIGPRRRRR